jgi:protein-tyrosine phosphatase
MSAPGGAGTGGAAEMSAPGGAGTDVTSERPSRWTPGRAFCRLREAGQVGTGAHPAVGDHRRMYRVVFVCSGNICRSPIAEKVFAREVEQAGLADRVDVASAGTGSWHVGGPADERAAALLVQHGYDDTHEARQVDDDLLAADLLVALDEGHLRTLRRVAPDPGRVRLLRSFDPAAPRRAGVPDPYYGGPDGFTEVLEMIRAAVPGLLEHVKAEL